MDNNELDESIVEMDQNNEQKQNKTAEVENKVWLEMEDFSNIDLDRQGENYKIVMNNREDNKREGEEIIKILNGNEKRHIMVEIIKTIMSMMSKLIRKVVKQIKICLGNLIIWIRKKQSSVLIKKGINIL